MSCIIISSVVCVMYNGVHQTFQTSGPQLFLYSPRENNEKNNNKNNSSWNQIVGCRKSMLDTANIKKEIINFFFGVV